MSSLPPIPPDIQRMAFGMLVLWSGLAYSDIWSKIIGYLLHWGLFGTLSTQVYMYFIAFPNDPWGVQLLVYGVYVVEVIQTVLLTQSCFRTFGFGFGDIRAVEAEGNLWFSAPIMSSFIAAVVQTFYAYRISILARSYVLPGVIVTIWNGASAACDILIAVGMTYYLSRMKAQWKQTREVVQKLIRLVIETGTLSATIATINLALLLLPGKPLYFESPVAVLGKIYSTTMMVVFNSRMKIVDGSHSANGAQMTTLSVISMGNNIPTTAAPETNGVLVTHDQFTNAMDDWSPITKKTSDDIKRSRGRFS